MYIISPFAGPYFPNIYRYELRYHHKADDDALVQPQVQTLIRHEPPEQRVRVRV